MVVARSLCPIAFCTRAGLFPSDSGALDFLRDDLPLPRQRSPCTREADYMAQRGHPSPNDQRAPSLPSVEGSRGAEPRPVQESPPHRAAGERQEGRRR
jgi:hypothetical protein